MKKSLALIMSLIMIFSTFSVCTVSANAATAAPAAAISTQEVDLENDFALIFKGMFREILNSFMKRFGFKNGFYVTDIDITQSKTSVEVNKSVQLKATLEPDKVKNNTITWVSDNLAIATVNANGIVTGKMAGATTIYAIGDGGFYDSCYVTVSNNSIPCTGVTLETTSVALKVNESAKIKVQLVPANTTDEIKIKHSDSNVATALYKNGELVITGNKAGTATIHINCGNIAKQLNVTVTEVNKDECIVYCTEKGRFFSSYEEFEKCSCNDYKVIDLAEFDYIEGAGHEKAYLCAGHTTCNNCDDVEYDNFEIMLYHKFNVKYTEKTAPRCAVKTAAGDYVCTGHKFGFITDHNNLTNSARVDVTVYSEKRGPVVFVTTYLPAGTEMNAIEFSDYMYEKYDFNGLVDSFEGPLEGGKTYFIGMYV